MQYKIVKPDGSEPVELDEATLALPGYAAFLEQEGYVLPGEFSSGKSEGSTEGSDASTAKAPVLDRAVETTPGGQPIYGNAASAKTVMDALFSEKMAQMRREQPALFPPVVGEIPAGPAEMARSMKWVPPHRREKYAENSWSANKVRKGLAVVDKKLNLSAVLRDRGVQEKYGVSDQQLHLVQVLMQVSPEKAAIKATECLRDNGHRVVVVADMTAAARSVARAALARAANEVGVHIRCREVPMTYLPGSTLVAMSPRKEDEDPSSTHTWELTGPGREFSSTAAVWVLIAEQGPFAVAEKYGHEYGFLRIMITVIEKSTSKATTLTPDYELHAGNRTDAWSNMSRDLLNSFDAVKDIDFGCVPVAAGDQGVVASVAVIDERWAVTPYHVLKTPGAKVGGELMEKADVKRLDTSVYAVMLKTPHVHTIGAVRAPLPGEAVALRLVGFDGAQRSGLVVTSSGTVVMADDRVYVSGCTASPGASGSIYVAESDGRPVGLHDGLGALGARLLPFNSDSLALLHAPAAWYGGGGPTMTRVLSPTVRFWFRSKVLRVAWTALAARFGTHGDIMTIDDGRCTRAAVPLSGTHRDGPWYKARDADTPLAQVYRGFRASVDGAVADLPTRAGVDGERVVIVCYDSEGLYMSAETTFGQECQFGKGNLAWLRMLRHGAIVVAVSDVAVLGSMARVAHTSDWVTFRVTGERASVTPGSESSGELYGPSTEENRSWLKERFPFLGVASYGPDALDECFTHSSCGKYQISTAVFSGYQNMARIGDAVMRARYCVVLRLRNVDPRATTELVNKWQNNDVQAVVAQQFGLDRQLRRASRLITIGQHGLADALEALACLVYFNEDASVLDKFLRVIAMFGEN